PPPQMIASGSPVASAPPAAKSASLFGVLSRRRRPHQLLDIAGADEVDHFHDMSIFGEVFRRRVDPFGNRPGAEKDGAVGLVDSLDVGAGAAAAAQSDAIEAAKRG